MPKCWGREDTAHLVNLRLGMEEDFISPNRHKTLWAKIEKNMKQAGYEATAKQCDNKFKALKREYKATVDYNSTSGNDRKTCPYFTEFNQMYGMSASVRPTFTLSTFAGGINKKESGTCMDIEDDNSVLPDKNNNQCKRKKKPAKPNDTPSWLQKYEERQVLYREKALKQAQEMHTEKMGMMANLIDILKKK